MSQISEFNGCKIYTLVSKNKTLQASFIPERGGIGCSIKLRLGSLEQELLYLHDFFWDKVWSDLPGGWPFLFPVCGRLEKNGKLGQYLYAENLYELPIHGFSWCLPWEVLGFDEQNLILSLQDNAQTRALYPFSFKVVLNYRVEEDCLVCEQFYENKGENLLPYYSGFHPYFLTPFPGAGKAEVYLDYKPTHRFIYNNRLTGLTGEQAVFKTPISIAAPEINEQLTQLGNDKKISLIYPAGLSLTLETVGLEDSNMFPYIQLYTMPDKPFFCIEPWMGVPNALNTVSGVRWLKPGESDKALLYLRFSHHEKVKNALGSERR